MANLIITVIAILMAGLLAGAGVYYAGSAFNSHQDKAYAVTLLNQAQQLQAAWTTYISSNLTAPTDWSALINAGLFNGVLSSPKAGTIAGASYQIWPDNGQSHYYVVADTGDPALGNGNLACIAILQTQMGVILGANYVPPTITDFGPSTLSHLGNYSCGPLGAGPTGTAVTVNNVAPVFYPLTHNIFIYRLS